MPSIPVNLLEAKFREDNRPFWRLYSGTGKKTPIGENFSLNSVKDEKGIVTQEIDIETGLNQLKKAISYYETGTFTLEARTKRADKTEVLTTFIIGNTNFSGIGNTKAQNPNSQNNNVLDKLFLVQEEVKELRAKNLELTLEKKFDERLNTAISGIQGVNINQAVLEKLINKIDPLADLAIAGISNFLSPSNPTPVLGTQGEGYTELNFDEMDDITQEQKDILKIYEKLKVLYPNYNLLKAFDTMAMPMLKPQLEAQFEKMGCKN